MADEKPADGAGSPKADPPKPAGDTPAADATPKGTGDAPAPKADDQATGSEPASKDGAAPPAPKAPEKYELVVPETGKAYAVPLLLEAIETSARANDWTNAEAQEELNERLTFAQAFIQKKSDAYLAATKADPEYGGAKFEETERLGRQLIDRIRPPGHARRESFLTFLGTEGAGNNIDVASFLADIGKQMGEDAPGRGRASGHGPPDGASKLYDHSDSRKLEEITR